MAVVDPSPELRQKLAYYESAVQDRSISESRRGQYGDAIVKARATLELLRGKSPEKLSYEENKQLYLSLHPEAKQSEAAAFAQQRSESERVRAAIASKELRREVSEAQVARGERRAEVVVQTSQVKQQLAGAPVESYVIPAGSPYPQQTMLGVATARLPADLPVSKGFSEKYKRDIESLQVVRREGQVPTFEERAPQDDTYKGLTSMSVSNIERGRNVLVRSRSVDGVSNRAVDSGLDSGGSDRSMLDDGSMVPEVNKLEPTQRKVETIKIFGAVTKVPEPVVFLRGVSERQADIATQAGARGKTFEQFGRGVGAVVAGGSAAVLSPLFRPSEVISSTKYLLSTNPVTSIGNIIESSRERAYTNPYAFTGEVVADIAVTKGFNKLSKARAATRAAEFEKGLLKSVGDTFGEQVAREAGGEFKKLGGKGFEFEGQSFRVDFEVEPSGYAVVSPEVRASQSFAPPGGAARAQAIAEDVAQSLGKSDNVAGVAASEKFVGSVESLNKNVKQSMIQQKAVREWSEVAKVEGTVNVGSKGEVFVRTSEGASVVAGGKRSTVAPSVEVGVLREQLVVEGGRVTELVGGRSLEFQQGAPSSVVASKINIVSESRKIEGVSPVQFVDKTLSGGDPYEAVRSQFRTVDKSQRFDLTPPKPGKVARVSEVARSQLSESVPEFRAGLGVVKRELGGKGSLVNVQEVKGSPAGSQVVKLSPVSGGVKQELAAASGRVVVKESPAVKVVAGAFVAGDDTSAGAVVVPGGRSAPVERVSSVREQRFARLPAGSFVSRPLGSTRVVPVSQIRLSSGTSAAVRLRGGEDVAPVSRPIAVTRLRPAVDSAVKPAVRQGVVQRVRQETVTAFRGGSPVRKVEALRSSQSVKRASSEGGGFVVEVRRRGLFAPLRERFASLAGARFAGERVVKGTAAASFRVRSVSGKVVSVPTGLSKTFYQSRKEPGVIVQRRGERLSSVGEKAEIKPKRGLFSKNMRVGKNVRF